MQVACKTSQQMSCKTCNASGMQDLAANILQYLQESGQITCKTERLVQDLHVKESLQEVLSSCKIFSKILQVFSTWDSGMAATEQTELFCISRQYRNRLCCLRSSWCYAWCYTCLKPTEEHYPTHILRLWVIYASATGKCEGPAC